MLELTLRYIPHGRRAAAEEIAVISIVNDGRHPDRPTFGNYNVLLGKQKIGRIASHKRSQSVAKLIIRAFEIFEVHQDVKIVEGLCNAAGVEL